MRMQVSHSFLRVVSVSVPVFISSNRWFKIQEKKSALHIGLGGSMKRIDLFKETLQPPSVHFLIPFFSFLQSPDKLDSDCEYGMVVSRQIPAEIVSTYVFNSVSCALPA